MSKFTVPAAATVIILLAAAPPASAQGANPEPGYCAQFYPNSDCNSVGPETPGSNKALSEPVEREAAPASPPVKPAKPRKQAHRSAAVAAGPRTPKTDAVAK